jgi:FkbM family methyltransferase
VRYRRARASGLDQLSRHMLEALEYRRSALGFMGATVSDPDMLITAPIDEHSTVVDAGAFVGEWAQAVVSRYGCDVIAFEPLPRIANEMKRRIGDDRRITCVPVALGADDATVPMEYHGPGSLLVPGGSSAPTQDVEVRDVAAVFDDLGIDHIDLLKLNIEGGEYDVLDRLLETGWMERIGVLVVQFHTRWPGAPMRRRRVRRQLRHTHVEDWNYPWVWERWVRAA